jgi:PIN domain nuclease of toxin-antitoxin system
MTVSKLFLDSSIWLGYLLGNKPATQPLVNSSNTMLFTSIISLLEIVKRLHHLNTPSAVIRESIRFVENNSIIVNLTKPIALRAVETCSKFKLHTIDSLIYASALELKVLFVTSDSDFKSAPHAKLLS